MLGLSEDSITLAPEPGDVPQPAEQPSGPPPPPVQTPPAASVVPPPPATPQPPAPSAQPAPRPAAAQPVPGQERAWTGNDVLDAFIRQLDADPQNHTLRLAIARVGGQAGMNDLAVQEYRDLIRRGALLDDVVADLSDLIAESEDEQVLRRLHKVLGDAYSKQGRFAEAVAEYSWTSNSPRYSN